MQSNYQDVFISYGRADSKAFATKLQEHLVQQDIKVWFDQNDIPLGVDFQNQIDDGLEKSSNFIFIIAPHSINSIYCGKEIELALRRNKRIIPLLHVEQITQEIWQQRNPNRDPAEWENYTAKGLHSSFANMHPAIGKINWVYFREGVDDFEKSFQGLLDLLHRHQDYVAQHRHLLVKALEWERNKKQANYLLGGEEWQAAQDWLNIRFNQEQPPCIPTDLHCQYICESVKNANNLMTQVFLSYSDKDLDIMQKVAYSLMREGFTIWTNKTDIQTGQDFQSAIDRGIEEADNLVFFISPTSLVSEYCQKELVYARRYNKRIIPLLIRPVDLANVPDDIRTVQFIDMLDNDEVGAYEADMDNLIRALREDASYYEQHKLFLAKALKWERQKRNPSILLRGHYLRQAEAWLKLAQGRSLHPATPIQEQFIAACLQEPPASTLDVFLCYAQSESHFTRKLNEGLQVQGKTTWFDQESVASGDDIQQERQRGIERCNNIVVILSPGAIADAGCQAEIAQAVELHKRIVPVMYSEADAALLHPSLGGLQAIEFRTELRDFFTSFGDLVRTLDADPQHVQTHTRLLVRTMEWAEHGRDDSYLLRGKDLSSSEDWLRQSSVKEPKPTEPQLEYLAASRELPRRRVRRGSVVLSSAIATALVTAARLLGMTQPVELWAYDRLLTLRPSEVQDKRLLIVGVDEPTLAMLPKRYPPSWGTLPDRALNDTLAVLSQAKPKLIGLDFIRDYKAPRPLAKRLKQTSNLIALCKITGNDQTIQGQGISPPPELPMEQIGFANVQDDGNKFLRRHILLQPPDEKFCNTIDAFTLVLSRRYLESSNQAFSDPFDNDGKLTRPLGFGKTTVPFLTGDGSGYRDRDDNLGGFQTLLNFRTVDGKLDRFAPMVSLKDLLENKVPAELIRDRVVMIGITASTSTKSDYWKTPYGEVPGVILQAQMVSQLLSATLDQRPLIWWLPLWAETVWVLGWSLLGGVIVWGIYRMNRRAIAGVVSGIVLAGGSYAALAGLGVWLPLIPAAIGFGIAGTTVQVLTYRLRHP